MLSYAQPAFGTDDGASAAVDAVTSTGADSLWLAGIDGPGFTHDGADPRFGGVFVAPRETVLGIRTWRDAYEGVESSEGGEVQWGIYEIEKIVRMMLHQSPLALEILSSPAGVERVASSRFEPRRVVESAITSDILTAYADEAEGLLMSSDASNLRDVAIRGLRRALLGLALAEGVVAIRLGDLLDWRGSETLANVVASADAEAVSKYGGEILDELRTVDASVLPESPADYDGLDTLVVETRMATLRQPDDSFEEAGS